MLSRGTAISAVRGNHSGRGIMKRYINVFLLLAAVAGSTYVGYMFEDVANHTAPKQAPGFEWVEDLGLLIGRLMTIAWTFAAAAMAFYTLLFSIDFVRKRGDVAFEEAMRSIFFTFIVNWSVLILAFAKTYSPLLGPLSIGLFSLPPLIVLLEIGWIKVSGRPIERTFIA